MERHGEYIRVTLRSRYDRLKKIAVYLYGFIYKRQITVLFPFPVIKRACASLPELPAGYSMQSPGERTDYAAWAKLFNKDGGFSYDPWTPESLRAEILANIAAPDAGTLLYYNGEMVGCSVCYDISKKGVKKGLGMFLYIDQAHRTHSSLAEILTFRSMGFFVRENYDIAIATTDPRRLSAIYLYLKAGCLPYYDSVYSYVQWFHIKKRLKKALDRDAKRKKRGG